MTSLLRKPLAKKVIAAIAVKEIVDRVQEARRPRKSFLRRNAGKIVVVALIGGGLVAYQRSKLSNVDTFGQTAPPSRRDPSIEPDERLDVPLRAPEEATDSSTQPAPAGR